MKKIIVSLIVLLMVFNALCVSACENLNTDAGNGDKCLHESVSNGVCSVCGEVIEENIENNDCQHQISEDGTCSLCGEDMLKKWETVFSGIENYKGFSEKEYTMSIEQVETSGENQETIVCEIIKNEKDKIYCKHQVRDEEPVEYYYENIPTEKVIMGYYLGENNWEKYIRNEEGSYEEELFYCQMQYGPYQYAGAVKNMVPDKMEYEDGKFIIDYNVYDGLRLWRITVEDDYITEMQIVINDYSTIKMNIKITYDEVDVTLPKVS